MMWLYTVVYLYTIYTENILVYILYILQYRALVKRLWLSNISHACSCYRMVEYWFEFSMTKNDLWSPWRLYMMGDFSGLMEMWILWWFVPPNFDKSVLWSWFAENGAKSPAFHFVPGGEGQLRPGILHKRPRTVLKLRKKRNVTSRWDRLTLFQHFCIHSTVLRNRVNFQTKPY